MLIYFLEAQGTSGQQQEEEEEERAHANGCTGRQGEGCSGGGSRDNSPRDWNRFQLRGWRRQEDGVQSLERYVARQGLSQWRKTTTLPAPQTSVGQGDRHHCVGREDPVRQDHERGEVSRARQRGGSGVSDAL